MSALSMPEVAIADQSGMWRLGTPNVPNIPPQDSGTIDEPVPPFNPDGPALEINDPLPSNFQPPIHEPPTIPRPTAVQRH